jgi:hypothetical protein
VHARARDPADLTARTDLTRELMARTPATGQNGRWRADRAGGRADRTGARRPADAEQAAAAERAEGWNQAIIHRISTDDGRNRSEAIGIDRLWSGQ